MTRDEVIERLCKMKSRVWNAMGNYARPCDCVCTKRWEEQKAIAEKFPYLGHPDGSFRHSDEALEWMERVISEALAKDPEILAAQAKEADEGDA